MLENSAGALAGARLLLAFVGDGELYQEIERKGTLHVKGWMRSPALDARTARIGCGRIRLSHAMFRAVARLGGSCTGT